jgi:excisionase family DNA binding protein
MKSDDPKARRGPAGRWPQPPKAMDRNALYTIQDVADLLRCERESVCALLRKGVLLRRGVAPGRKILRISGDDLLAFLESRRSGGPQPRMAYKRLGL